MESIQQVAEQFIRNVSAIDITEGLSGAWEEARRQSGAFVCRLTENKLMYLDAALFGDRSLRKNWTIEHSDEQHELLT